MVKVNVISGFLGAGKTTLIKKLLTGRLRNEKVVLLENEYGEIGIDGGFMKDAGITVTELNAGCICCTLAGDFQAAVDQLIDTYHPDRILVEPTGVGKLSEILSAVEKAKERHSDIETGGSATVVDAGKCRMYMKNFGEFFLDQVKSASTVIFSRTQLLDAARVEKSRQLIAEAHPTASPSGSPRWMMTMMTTTRTNTSIITITTMIMTTMRMSMSIITTITTMMMTMTTNTSITIITTIMMTTTMTMITIMSITIMSTAKAAPAAATTMTIIITITTTAKAMTRTKCSATSALKPRSGMSRTRSAACWRSCPTKRNTARCCGPRVSCRTRPAAGSSLTMCPAKSICATAARTTPAACA